MSFVITIFSSSLIHNGLSQWKKKYDARILSGYYSSNICKYEKNKIRIFLLWNILQDKSSTKTINNCYCQLAEDTANLTPPDKKPCLAQSRKEKVIFPLWNQIQGRGCRGLVTAEQHIANSRHNSRPHLPPLISQTAGLRWRDFLHSKSR